ncbi:protein PSK SIMULATOR 1 [Tasmannia lanceolata]|uniref:protein PSK SIMULATOR 1 n=1 Tax=Tasmannia lanceolata TaxID=3420 RepID=UPI004063AA51
MALESWLIKVKTAISNGLDSVRTVSKNGKKSNVGVLAFEIAGLMSKLLQLWQSLSDKNVHRLRHEAIALEGVRKIVSNDDAFLLVLACAEMAETLRLIAKSVSRLATRCDDSALRCFDEFFEEFANSGRDTHNWVLSWKEMDSKAKKMNRYVTSTASLRKEMDEISEMEHSLHKLLQCKDQESPMSIKKIDDLQQKIFWQKQEVKYLKESSLWRRTFDVVTLLLAKSVFTVLARVKLFYGIGHESPAFLPRSISVSATVHPSENSTTNLKFVSGPLISKHNQDLTCSFFDSNSKLLKPPPSTLGAAALALHYANLIIVLEKMIRSPQLIGIDARDDLYAMLPTSLRVALRGRLRGVGFSAGDPVLAGEWRDAMWKILEWLAPLAHNMIKWQSDRSFEQHNMVPRTTNVLLLQTLYFANQAKTEAVITELLVGLNYVWRFEREMNAKALVGMLEF